MNYFELFDMPVSLQPDAAAVRAKFYELSRRYHPDFHSNASEAEQAGVLEKSSDVNKAYKVLTDPDETIRYVLQLNGLMEADERYQLPPAFLGQMMELNEQALEDGPAHVAEQLADLLDEIYQPVKPVIENYRHGETTREDLLRVKDYYFKKKYLNRAMRGG